MMDSRLAAYVTAFERESAITLKVLRAFPAEQAELRPHERSSSARQLAWTFVAEQRMALGALREGQVLGGGAGAGMPESFDEIVAQFEAVRAELIEAARSASAEQVERTVKFFTGPKQIGDYQVMDFLWFLLHDQIHHRGQLTVYVRMAGGRVPSVYGPSADEPWS